jgi:hypothetical protein
MAGVFETQVSEKRSKKENRKGEEKKKRIEDKIKQNHEK